MATLAQGMGASPPAGWLWGFLKDELAQYPGRMATVGRMVLAATLVALICDTFRVPFAYRDRSLPFSFPGRVRNPPCGRRARFL